jgi:hypothetical protein
MSVGRPADWVFHLQHSAAVADQRTSAVTLGGKHCQLRNNRLFIVFTVQLCDTRNAHL